MGRFAVISESLWKFAESVPLSRRDHLLHGRSYERTVAEMLSSCTRLTFQKQQDCKRSGARCIVTAHVDPSRLDRFFSSSCGYRAQYLLNPDDGHLADHYAIEASLSFFLRSLSVEARRAKDKAFIEASLQHPWAKVWPYQGLWLRRARRSDRVLLVPSWQRELASPDKHRRRLARWGSLAPNLDPRIQFKGGFVQGSKHLFVGKPQAKRAHKINELGFT